MKKIVLLLILPLAFLFCGCDSGDKGETFELKRYDWTAELEGGGELKLSFDGDFASLELKNCGDSAVIKGRMLADGESFIIFDDELMQCYSFSYVPRGDRLDLTYEGSTVELTAAPRS